MPKREKFPELEKQAGNLEIKTMTKREDKTKRSTVNYPIGDFIIRMKNAALAGNKVFETERTKFTEEACKVLKKMGFIEDFQKKHEKLAVSLMFKHKKPLILGVKLVSRPGLRVYKGADELAKVKGPSSFLVSTPKGLLTSKEAIKERAGGEVIAEIW